MEEQQESFKGAAKGAKSKDDYVKRVVGLPTDSEKIGLWELDARVDGMGW